MNTILLTGGIGFIGSHLAETLLQSNTNRVICIDNFDDFYSVSVKKENLNRLASHPHFRFVEADITAISPSEWENICGPGRVDMIIHLAAKAGVRPSIFHPAAYYNTNVNGTLNLLELAHLAGVPRFIFTSSSSVYGNNIQVPWKESDQYLRPISPYAASKIAAEQAGQVYAHLYDLHFTALRLFTVYGPRQRPDLAVHKFYNLMKQGREITLYGDGSTSRDYTFVSDIVNGIRLAADYNPEQKFTVFNIGNGRPVTLLQMVYALEEGMQVKADINFTSEQPGDVKQTWADISLAEELLHYHPAVSLAEGIHQFLEWKEAGRLIV